MDEGVVDMFAIVKILIGTPDGLLGPSKGTMLRGRRSMSTKTTLIAFQTNVSRTPGTHKATAHYPIQFLMEERVCYKSFQKKCCTIKH